ncbi:MAG: helix-turn-helix domain-containing protein [Armatimonadota bacterium]
MANTEDKPEIMTITEAAAFLRLNPRTLYGLAQRGEIPAQKLGNRWRFSKSAILEWMKAGNAPAETSMEDSGQ